MVKKKHSQAVSTRFIRLFIAMVLIASVMPYQAFAEESEQSQEPAKVETTENALGGGA